MVPRGTVYVIMYEDVGDGDDNDYDDNVDESDDNHVKILIHSSLYRWPLAHFSKLSNGF